MRLITRRQFVGGTAGLAGLGFSSGRAASAPAGPGKAKPSGFLKEHGFWDYTTPGAGGMEHYQRDDYLRLLDDMAQAGMNSLLIMVNWFSTGYRSRLPWLDQDPQNAVIASDNALLRLVLEEAAKRRIKTWLGVVVSHFEVDRYGGKPRDTRTFDFPGGYNRLVGIYDADMPEGIERAAAIYEELVTLFPQANGFLVEQENGDAVAPHRVKPYNKWAADNGRPEFKTLRIPLPQEVEATGQTHRLVFPPPWRDYVTFSRSRLLRAVESTLRSKGFKGDLVAITDTGNAPYVVMHVLNLEYLHELAPDWAALTYDYWKWQNRYAAADFNMVEPKKAGIKAYYLPRGVMTWPPEGLGGGERHLPMSLEESWRLDVEDVQQFQPDGLWWFGSGAVGEGWHVGSSILRKMGFTDGVQARRRLLEVAKPLLA